MLDPTSRYYDLENTTIRLSQPDGTTRQVAYKKRRFLPPLGAAAALTEHPIQDGERLDNLAASYLGDPTLFWRLCDSNLVFHPQELTAVPGRVIAIGLNLR